MYLETSASWKTQDKLEMFELMLATFEVINFFNYTLCNYPHAQSDKRLEFMIFTCCLSF